MLVYEISLEPLNGFMPNSHEDVFGPLLGVWRSRSKIKVTWEKRHFSALSVACVRFMFGKSIFSL